MRNKSLDFLFIYLMCQQPTTLKFVKDDVRNFINFTQLNCFMPKIYPISELD